MKHRHTAAVLLAALMASTVDGRLLQRSDTAVGRAGRR